MQDIMNATDIAFPNLGLYLENVPQGFYIGNFYVALYGIIIGIGVIAGITMAAHAAKVTGMNPDDIWDFALYAVIFSVLGARIYYVVFEWENYKDNIVSVFKIREGGLAIYGAVIGAFITLFIYTRIKKCKALNLGDAGVTGLVLGQVIGRWGNFFNREVFGEYTDNILAMRLPIAALRDRSDISDNIRVHILEGTNYIQVHLTFLYESGLNLLLLVCMLLYLKHKKFDGEICLLYLGGYGIIRFFVEGIRTDQLKLAGTNIAVSQVLGMILFIFAVVTDIAVRIYSTKKNVIKEEKSNN